MDPTYATASCSEQRDSTIDTGHIYDIGRAHAFLCDLNLRVAHSVKSLSLSRILRQLIPDGTDVTQPLAPFRDTTFLTHNYSKYIYRESREQGKKSQIIPSNLVCN